MRKQFRYALFTLLVMGATTFLSIFFHLSTRNTINIAILYILAILIAALFTEGYFWGIVASVAGVICVNWLFTYPYMRLDFTRKNYPLTFLGMLAISILAGAMASHFKKLARQNQRLAIEAEKEKMRSNLLRAVSHDLRTPLTGMIGASAAYMENEDTLSKADKNNLVSQIHEDAQWLLHMVENLLTVTRIDQDTAAVHKEPEPIEEIVAEAAGKLKKRYPDARLNIRVPDEFLMVPMDATLIEQVLLNLMENSILHGKGTRPIDLTAGLKSGCVWFAVRDYGVGFPADRLPDIFDGYVKNREDNGEASRGMGIGLSICKAIILAHGGQIQAENLEEGAQISFTLPYKGETDHEE